MKTSTKSHFWIKVFSLFTVIRGYNIVVLILAQYLTSSYILAPDKDLLDIIFDPQLFSLVLATASSTAAGYIINNFYDAEKDKINRPKKYLLEHLISQQSQLVLYFLINGITLIAAGFVSFNAILFFTVYIFSIWIYSTSLKRLFWISNLFATLLVIVPFFAVTLYFNNFETIIFYHATFLFLVILTRDMIKDLENYKGDWVKQYRTFPVVFGYRMSKILITLSVVLTFLPIYWLINSSLGLMSYYFYFTIPLLLILLIFLWQGSSQKRYLWLHNLLKAHILFGVLGIYFIYK